MNNTMNESTWVPIGEIDADDDFNCRGTIAPVDVSSLAQDIREEGLLQPGIVMPHPDPNSGYKYKLVAGFRRRMACKVLGFKEFWVVVKNIADEDAMFLNLNENIQRAQLSILQEARAIHKIKVKNPKIGREGCAKKLGMSPGWVQVREQLLNLPVEVQNEVDAGIITQTQIRELNVVMRKEGVQRCYEVAREIKKAKQAGRKPRVKKKKDRTAIRERKRSEIFEMMADINDSIPYKDKDGNYYLWPRALAWASGQISDAELFETCEAFAKKNGHIWSEPSCDAREEEPTLDDVKE